jgi:hypothetical protein
MSCPTSSASQESGGMTDIAEDDPITLAEACKLFPRAKFTVSTLRAEADRERLEIFGIGRRDYTTLRSMREMVRLCRQTDKRRKPIRREPATAQRASLAAANETVRMLKGAGRPKLPPLISGNRGGDVRKRA